MKHYPRSRAAEWPRRPILDEYGHVAHNSTVKRLLGLSPRQHIPLTAVAPVTVNNGWRLYVVALGENGRRFHRVRAVCPYCNLDISAGRTGQHVTHCKGSAD